MIIIAIDSPAFVEPFFCRKWKTAFGIIEQFDREAFRTIVSPTDYGDVRVDVVARFAPEEVETLMRSAYVR